MMPVQYRAGIKGIAFDRGIATVTLEIDPGDTEAFCKAEREMIMLRGSHVPTGCFFVWPAGGTAQ